LWHIGRVGEENCNAHSIKRNLETGRVSNSSSIAAGSIAGRKYPAGCSFALARLRCGPGQHCPESSAQQHWVGARLQHGVEAATKSNLAQRIGAVPAHHNQITIFVRSCLQNCCGNRALLH